MRWMVLAIAMVGCDDGLIDDVDLGTDTDMGTDAMDDDTDTSDVDTEPDIDTEPDTEEPIPVPVEGTWSTGGLAVTSDPCGLTGFRDASEFLPATLVVSAASTTSFDMGATVADSQTCAYTSPGFTCGRFSLTEDTGVGADLILDQGLTGNVLSETAMLGTLDLTATCEGVGCALVELGLGGETFPCDLQATFNINNP